MYSLGTDTSEVGIKSVFYQIGHSYKELFIRFGNQALNRSEKVIVTRKEILAVVKFVRKYRPYLLGINFMLSTYYEAPQWPQNFGRENDALARLQNFGFERIHRLGRQHKVSDFLSQQPVVSH